MGKMEKDITGNKYGHLIAIKRYGNTNDGHPMWLFKCSCGNEHVARKSSVTRGEIKSCGKCIKNVPPIRIKHGKSHDRVYGIWNSMVRRCLKKSKSHHSRYYDRGITVCEEWKEFTAFWEWAKNNGYRDDLTIDRIDNNKGYYPENCRWTTTHVQARNKRNNVNYTYKGETHCLADWANIAGINEKTFWFRYKNGDRNERLFRPVRGN